MIVKKLAVPLINEKVLREAEHCYIATAAISEAAFDFVKSRLSPKCKIEIVTGLDVPTSPQVLQRIWRHYQDRITFHVYTRNNFNPNVYIFDLPYRKTIAFIGSGHFTLGGLKDHEEIFYKVKDAKEIEALKSWFTGYYEFSEPLTESMIEEYELLYPSLKRREIESQHEKKEFIALATGGFSWDNIKFKNQYFKKEDYLIFGSRKASLNTPEVQVERIAVKDKLLSLHELIKNGTSDLKLLHNLESNYSVSNIDPLHYSDKKVRTISLAYKSVDKKEKESEYSESNSTQLQIVVKQKEVGVLLLVGTDDHKHFNVQMNDAMYRNDFFTLLTSLKIESKGNDYWLEIAGEVKTIENFQNDNAFWDFTRLDQRQDFCFIIGKSYAPGAAEISTDVIGVTVAKDMEKLILLYRQMVPVNLPKNN